MSYNPQLWQELGLNTWQLKPEFQTSLPESNAQIDPPTQTATDVSVVQLDSDTQIQDETSTTLQKIANPPTYTEETKELKKLLLFGHGLKAIWKQQDNPAWQLWRSILNFHLTKPEQLVFYDTAELTDEDKIFDLLDELAEQGFETAYSMDNEHPINEILAENIQLEFLPSLEEMLDNPILKRDLFEKLSQEFPWQAK